MLSSYVSLYVGIDWNLNGTFTDESSYARTLQITRGRSDANDLPSAGTGTIVLSNRTGRFSPFNTGSALYPYVLPGRPIKIEATYDSVTYPIFRGYATPSFPTRGIDSEISFSLVDEFDKLSKPPFVSTQLAQDALISTLIADVLTAIGYTGPTDIDTSELLLEYWSNHKAVAVDAIRTLAAQNLGGMPFMQADGTFRFENKVYRSQQLTAVEIADDVESIEPELRFEDLITEVVVSYPRFTITPDLQAAYSLNPVGKRLDAGANTFSVDFSGVGVTGAVQPVPYTDFEANSEPDGSGVDKTAQVSVSSFSATGGGADLEFTNADSSPVYLTYLQVRGYVVQTGNELDTTIAETVNPVVGDTTYEVELEAQNTTLEVQAFAEYTAEQRGKLSSRINVQIVPDTDARMVEVLSSDISTKVHIDDTQAEWLTQIDGYYFVEQIQLAFDATAQNKVVCTWLLFDERLGEGDGFVINDDIATDWPASVIVNDAVTDGKVIFK